MSVNAKCVGPLNATILSSESPGEISVRLSVFDGPFSRLKDKINVFYNKNALDLRLAPPVRFGDTVAVFNNSCWCRAKIIGIQQETVTLHLLDYAKKVQNVCPRDLHTLDDSFIRPNAYAFFCHLPHVCSTAGPAWHPALIEEMKKLVGQYGPEVEVLPLGPTQLTTDDTGCSIKSLPVEVIWTYEEADNPFEPNKTKQISLSAKLRRNHFAVTVEKVSDEETFEPYEDDDIPASAAELMGISAAELMGIDIMTDSDEGEEYDLKEVEDTKKFRWLDPEIPAKSEFRARCTHVDDAGQIYLHLYENRSTMRFIREILQDKYRKTRTSGKEPEKIKEKLEEGQECIARYRDGNWYRGRVLDATDEESIVLFVDYGNNCVVKNRHIRSGLYCKENPILAIRVVLGNVKPWDGTETWSDGSLDFMQQKLHYDHPQGNHVVFVKVIGSRETLPLQVTIELPPTTKDGVWIDLGDLLVNSREAVFRNGFNPSQELRSKWDKLSFGVSCVAAGTHQIKTIETQTPKAKPMFCKQLFPALNLNDVSEGDIIDFQLVEVLSRNKILVYPTKDNSGSKLSRLAEQFTKMTELLQTNADRMLPIINPTDGLPVATRYPGDKEGWYRGVIQQHTASKVLVQFVDYGPQTFWLNSDQVKALPVPCLSVPVAGIELLLPHDAASQEEGDENLGMTMMMEVLDSLGTRLNDEIFLKVKISEVKPQLTGHIIKQHFPVLELNDVSEGDIIDLQLVEVLSYNKILVCPSKGKCGSQLSRLTDQYSQMMKLLQTEAEKLPPIIHATDGLPVAARFPRSDTARTPKMEWFRGVVKQHSHDKFMIEFVDHGPDTYWLDRDEVKVLPNYCLSVSVTVMELDLLVDPTSEEEDDIDVVTAMMMEALFSLGTTLNDDILLKVKISKVKPQLAGHVIDPENDEPVYRRLEKEGLLTIKS